ncbi:hypothetical protein FNL55_13500 [Tardiphaga sp. vice352]|uniref:hypothetical protein n=1 Tax=Tardiphaga sp. vice352 TaxID=2592816 RepID=UPI001163E7F7|nr:hypothetical protein [Tardiphaga sp. vice352]QDM32244.1 hypothetical protein FNL55_13500 [Tardiphaga sp. vice352]
MKFKIALILGLFCFGSTAQAAFFDNNGNTYFERCSKTPSDVICTAIASGYLDMMNALGYKCPNNEGMSRSQAADVLIKNLRDYPADRNQPLALLAVVAFENALQCARPGTSTK